MPYLLLQEYYYQGWWRRFPSESFSFWLNSIKVVTRKIKEYQTTSTTNHQKPPTKNKKKQKHQRNTTKLKLWHLKTPFASICHFQPHGRREGWQWWRCAGVRCGRGWWCGQEHVSGQTAVCGGWIPKGWKNLKDVWTNLRRGWRHHD